MKRLGVALVTLVLISAAPAGAQTGFPRLRTGAGQQPISGGGVVAGDPFVPGTAVVAWNQRWHTLTLYLLAERGVTCGTLRDNVQQLGHVIQVYIAGTPSVSVGRPVVDPQVTFMTLALNAPMHVAGLKNGAQVVFTRVDSYPGGVWHGIFKVPRLVYADGKLYGYNGTFAAKWCELQY